MTRRRAALAVGVALVLTGCGSTVQLPALPQASPGDAAPSVGSAPGGLPLPAVSSQRGTPNGAVSGRGEVAATPMLPVRRSTGGGRSTHGPGRPAPAGTAAGQASGRGFTADTILIGVATAKDSGAFAKGLGVSGTDAGDVNAQMNAIARDINGHGGILGRKVVLVPHDYNSTQAATNPATANQTACADWTEDHHVFAVIGPLIVDDTLLSCLARTGTPLLELGGGVDYPLHYSATYRHYPLFFNIDQMVGDEFDRIAVSRLVQRKFFAPWNTLAGRPGAGPVSVGLLGYTDGPGSVQISDEVAQLKAHGISVASRNIVRCPRNVVSAASCNTGAVLKFKANRVTHVWGAGLLFMGQAQTQGYHPRYFIQNSTRILAENAPRGQLNGAMGESYIPIFDVERAQYPGDPTSAAAHCRRVMRASNVEATESSVLYNEYLLCDGFYFLQAALSRAGALGASQLVEGLESLGGSQPSALTWSTLLSKSEHTSVHALRDLAYNAGTSRWSYPNKRDYSS